MADIRAGGARDGEAPADGEVPEDGEVPRPDRLDSFKARLDYLFRTVHPRSGKPFTHDFVAESITANGVDISANYIWMLRTGRRDNPTLRHIEGLAQFFGVSPAFLSDTDEAEHARAQLDKLSDLAASGVQHVSMRGSHVDDTTLDTIHALMQQVLDLTSGLRRDAPASPAASADEGG